MWEFNAPHLSGKGVGVVVAVCGSNISLGKCVASRPLSRHE